MAKTKRIGDLKSGDEVICLSPVDGRRHRGTITFAGPHSTEKVWPHRRDAKREKVDAWSVFWRFDNGNERGEVGHLFDPDDRVEIG